MRCISRSTGLLCGASLAAVLLLATCRDAPEITEPDAAVVARRTLTVSGGGTGDGTVTSSPAGVNCVITGGQAATSGCVVAFDRNTVVSLTATAKTGHAFRGWYQSCTGLDGCTLAMSKNFSVQARFYPGPFTLRVGGTAGGGNGTVRSQAGLSPAINCVITNGTPGTRGCSGKYPANTLVILTATPAAGYVFDGWSGVCGGSGSCQHRLIKTVTVPAAFVGATSATAASEGRWSPTFITPMVAIHTHLLPSGKVLAWGNKGDGYLWDPSDPGAGFVQVPKAFQQFCAGHAYLADGRLLVAGGHISSDHGLRVATIFDPGSGGWSNTASMAQGRWYPTSTTLPDGEVLTLAGADENAVMVPVPEVWGNGGWRRLTSASLTLPYYPAMFVAPNGRVFLAGPGQTTRYLDTDGTGEWSTVADRNVADRNTGSAAMYAPGKILYAGGGDPPTATAEVIDLNDAAPSWRTVPGMAFPRRHTLATLLPDGTVLFTHGTSGPGTNDLTSTVRYPELWRPTTEAWTTMARETVERAYHSSAILLPDGRVLSSGSGESDGITFPNSQLTAQIFSPPYLFDSEGRLATRPVITSAPAQLSYGEPFTVGTPDAASIAGGSLVRLSSVTHSVNMTQVIVPLTVTPDGGDAVQATAPDGGHLAPPGPYMLFLLDQAGVPSVSRMVLLGP